MPPIKVTAQPPAPPLAFGVVGIGRMGQKHALNLLRLIPNAKLVCVCSPAAPDIEWASHELAPHGIAIYESFEEMVGHEGLQAVIISSLTTLHYYHTVESLKRGIHVLCEKPICNTEEEVSAANHHSSVPSRTFICATLLFPSQKLTDGLHYSSST
jgi:predicted dehydrogenase